MPKKTLQDRLDKNFSTKKFIEDWMFIYLMMGCSIPMGVALLLFNLNAPIEMLAIWCSLVMVVLPSIYALYVRENWDD